MRLPVNLVVKSQVFCVHGVQHHMPMQGLSTPLAAPAGTALLSTSTCGPRRAPAALCFIVLIILSFLQLHFNSLELLHPLAKHQVLFCQDILFFFYPNFDHLEKSHF